MPTRRVIAFDAGGTKLLGGVVDAELRLEERVLRRWPGGDRDDVLATIAGAVEEARADAEDAAAVGFGIPSLVDFERGYSISSVHLPLDDIPFRDLIADRVGLPVLVDNDANLAALAEHRAGAGRGSRDMVLLTIGTGIGGGLVLNGELYRGIQGMAGELGHMTIDVDGPPCPGNCPGRGCLEAFVSGQAIARAGVAAGERRGDTSLARALGQGVAITGELVTELAISGDPAAREAIEEIGELLGAGLAAIINAFNPETVVIGGGAATAGELLLAPARRVAGERALRAPARRARIVPAHFGEEAGLVGAALMALEAIA